MAMECSAGQYWDSLIRQCMHCHTECYQAQVMPRCVTYCESAKCKALPGHYYDGLLRMCMTCAEVCGRHPAECWQHCHTPGAVSGLEDPALLLYPLVAMSLVLLFSSLSLALLVLLRTSRTRGADSSSKEADCGGECAGQLCQEVSRADFEVDSHHPTSFHLSDDSSPTETCVCIHCFPDLKALSQVHDRPPKAPISLYPSSRWDQNGGPLQTQVTLPTSEGNVQQESAEG